MYNGWRRTCRPAERTCEKKHEETRDGNNTRGAEKWSRLNVTRGFTSELDNSPLQATTIIAVTVIVLSSLRGSASNVTCIQPSSLICFIYDIGVLYRYLYLYHAFTYGWTTSSAEAFRQLRPNAQPRHDHDHARNCNDGASRLHGLVIRL